MPMSSQHAAQIARSPNSGLRPIEVIGKSGKADEGVFETMLDAINPLQQIPGVGQAYRKVSGDKTSNGAQLAGHIAVGAAIGGPIGMAAGAGLFILEKALPGVFGVIGKLFSSGKNSDMKADMPGLVGEPKSPLIPRRPLIEGLDVRPGSKPRVSQSQWGQPQLGKAAPSMSMAQFEALMSSIGAQPIDASARQPGKSSAAQSDVAALIQANLDKYHRQQRQGTGLTGR